MIVRWKSDLVNTKESIRFVVNLITRTNGRIRYREEDLEVVQNDVLPTMNKLSTRNDWVFTRKSLLTYKGAGGGALQTVTINHPLNNYTPYSFYIADLIELTTSLLGNTRPRSYLHTSVTLMESRRVMWSLNVSWKAVLHLPTAWSQASDRSTENITYFSPSTISSVVLRNTVKSTFKELIGTMESYSL